MRECIWCGEYFIDEEDRKDALFTLPNGVTVHRDCFKQFYDMPKRFQTKWLKTISKYLRNK